MSQILIGKDAKAYYSTSGLLLSDTTTSTTWVGDTNTVIADNMMDVSLDLTSELVDATTRQEAATGWRSEIAVLRNGRITFDLRWEHEDPAPAGSAAEFRNKIVAAWEASSAITLAFFDNATSVTGAQGLIANFSVSLTKNEALIDVQKASVSLTIHSYPEWKTIP